MCLSTVQHVIEWKDKYTQIAPPKSAERIHGMKKRKKWGFVEVKKIENTRNREKWMNNIEPYAIFYMILTDFKQNESIQSYIVALFSHTFFRSHIQTLFHFRFDSYGRWMSRKAYAIHSPTNRAMESNLFMKKFYSHTNSCNSNFNQIHQRQPAASVTHTHTPTYMHNGVFIHINC